MGRFYSTPSRRPSLWSHGGIIEAWQEFVTPLIVALDVEGN
jgi:hypothetical protein